MWTISEFYLVNFTNSKQKKAEGEKTMKKKLALLLATVMATTPLSALNVSVSAAEVEDIYADVYGIEVEFGAEPEEADIADLTLTKIDGEEAVAVAWAVGETGEKRTIVPGENLEADEAYRLSFGTTEKEFMVKTIFFEDFNDTSAFTTQDVSDTTPFEYTNAYGDIEVSYGTKGAFIKNSKVWVTNGALTVSNLDTYANLSDTTLMADVEGYAKTYIQGPLKRVSQDQVHIHMLSRAQAGNALASGVVLNRADFSTGITSDAGVFASKSASSTYPSEEQADTTTNTNFDFGKMTQLTVDTVTSADTIELETNKHNVALRTNGASVTAFADTESTTYANGEVATTAGDYVLGLTSEGRGIAVFDNVRITAYTEDTEEISGELTPLTLENSNYEKLVLTFDKRLRDLGPAAISAIQVLKDGTDITSQTTITLDTEDDTKLNIVPDTYNVGHTYSVVIPDAFGKGSLLTTQEHTLSVDVQATPIAVTGYEFKPEGIEITFDTDLTDLTDDADLSAVSVSIGDENCENFVADSSATVTKDGAVLKVVPSDYAVNKSYKVVIPVGFGSITTQVTQEYTLTELFEKISIEAKKVDGNEGLVEIEFTEPVDKDDPTLNLSGISVYEVTRGANGDYTTSAPKTITPTVTNDGKLLITFPSMEADKIYEVYVPQTFGTDTVGLTQDIRKKFTYTTFAYEDFDGNSIGAVGGGLTTYTDRDSANKRGYVSGNYYSLISNDEIAATENFTMEFDFQLFFYIKKLNSTYYTDKYDDTPRASHKLMFNKQGEPQTGWLSSEEDYLSILFREKRIGFSERVNKATAQSGGTDIPYFVNGDAIKTNGTVYVYHEGEAFQDNMTFETKAGEIVETCQRPEQPARHFKIVKTGAHIVVYREDDNGVMAKLFEVTPSAGAPTKGLIEYGGDGNSIDTFDNISFKRFELVEDEDVVAADLAITTTGDISAQSTLEGTYKIKNYSNSSKDVCAIVAGYDANGSMLCADLDATTSIAPGGELNLDFDLISLTGTTSIKLFLWENTTNRAQIGVYDFPIAP